MQRVLAVRGLAAMAAVLVLISLPGCGGGNSTNNKVTSVILVPTTISLNEGSVVQLSATAQASDGTAIAADISFTSSDNSIATVSSGGLLCGGVWDANIINCNATMGQGGVGQVTITATATAFNVSATATVYVHEKVDQVQTIIGTSCTSMGQPVNVTGKAFSTSAPGCSPQAPCDITSTVGPFTFGSNDSTIAASSSGIVSTFSSTTNTPTYTSGGTITGAKGQTCTLSSFNGVTNATATVPLTSQNTIASGTQLTITSPGFGATVAPTTATLAKGSATCSGTATVQTEITSGVMTAESPGITTLFSSVSGVNSVGVPYQTCSVASILVHSSSGSQTSFSLSAPNTQGLTADVLDTNNVAITPTLNWGSSSTAVATVAATGTSNGATVTAVGGGSAYVTASCAYPNCNKGVSAQYSQNVTTFNVSSGLNTTVYAASTNSTMLVPISTTNNTPSAAITLPFTPNSIIADPAGKAVYLGSSSGLMALVPGGTTVTTFGTATGTILAISPDGASMLLSDDVNNKLVYFDISTGTVLATAAYTATSSAYTPDSAFNVFVDPAPPTPQLGVGYPSGFIAALTLPFTPNFADVMAQGGLIYISSASNHEIATYSTCNQAPNQTLTAVSPTFITAIPNGTGAVAVDPPALDVVSTPSTLSAGCPVATQSSFSSFDLGQGSFTPAQLLIDTESANVWVLSNLSNLISFNLPSLTAGSVPIAGGAMPLNGGLTVDGTQLWVGTSDNTVHRIDTALPGDVAQVAVNLTNSSGGAVAPNLVAVLP
jgi:hypothetical protein